MIKMKLDTRALEKAFDQASDVPAQASEEAYRYFVKTTPIAPINGGNARSRTVYNQNSKTITGDYAYAQRLDEGYSKQAPQGMSEPTIAFFEKRVNELIRKIP